MSDEQRGLRYELTCTVRDNNGHPLFAYTTSACGRDDTHVEPLCWLSRRRNLFKEFADQIGFGHLVNLDNAKADTP